MDVETMRGWWARLEAWLGVHAPELLKNLQPGATEEEIVQAEAALAVKFPDDFKASCFVHNGQANYETGGLIDARELLSLERIRDEWAIWKDLLDGGDFEGSEGDPSEGIRSDWWNPRWIPITYDGAGNHDCLDLEPAGGGHIGQIIDFWHDDADRSVKAESFGAWFAAFVEGCEAGWYAYSDEYGGIVRAEDL